MGGSGFAGALNGFPRHFFFDLSSAYQPLGGCKIPFWNQKCGQMPTVKSFDRLRLPGDSVVPMWGIR